MDDDEDDGAPEIKLYPLVSWEIASLSNKGILLRIAYLPGIPARPIVPEHASALAESLTVGMTAAECEDLGNALIRAAKEAQEGRAGRIE